MDITTFKSVAEIGISSTIAVIFLRQQQKLFGQQEQVIQVLAKLEQNLNSDVLKGYKFSPNRLFTYLRKYDIIETCDERVFTEV